jgi:predicted ATP-grasp superfamily ATP-dependent carboligase
MTSLFEHHSHRQLDAPVLVVALEGWIDAGYVAGSASQLLLDRLTTEPVATFDADALLDHRARRPVMHLVDGVNTGLTWPSIQLSAASDLAGNDVLVLHGAEPDHTWRAFTRTVVDLALGLDARLVVGLGAYPAPTPHTRPTLLSVTAGTEDLAESVQLLRGTLDVPAGVQAAIEHHATEVGVPALGLWAQVPHYAAGMPYPAGVLALLEQLQRVSGLTLPEEGLAEETVASRERLDSIIAGNPEHQDMVSALEREVDAQVAQGPPGNLPSGDELAAELERFLRDQSKGD